MVYGLCVFVLHAHACTHTILVSLIASGLKLIVLYVLSVFPLCVNSAYAVQVDSLSWFDWLNCLRLRLGYSVNVRKHSNYSVIVFHHFPLASPNARRNTICHCSTVWWPLMGAWTIFIVLNWYRQVWHQCWRSTDEAFGLICSSNTRNLFLFQEWWVSRIWTLYPASMSGCFGRGLEQKIAWDLQCGQYFLRWIRPNKMLFINNETHSQLIYA